MEKQKRTKRTFSTSVAVTEKNLAYLRKLPNASELFRRFLDAMEAADGDIQQKLATVILGIELEKLNNQLEELSKKRAKFLTEHLNCWEKEWETNTASDGHIWKSRTDRLKFNANGEPIPIQGTYPNGQLVTPQEANDAELAFKLLKGYDVAICALGAKIEEIKKRIMAA